jgi:Ca2+/H+ antiporter
MSAAAVLAVLCILGVPVFSAFRVELVFVPIAAFGLAYAAELATARVGDRYGALVRPAVRIPARARRS